MKTRTRFAPSPTGYQHVGNIRTGLFAWLLARQNSGTFILRIEDTDQKREVSDAVEHVQKCIEILGIHPDEGVGIGGEFGPYRQSERLELYQAWAKKLIDKGRAYADPYTAEEVQAFREQAQKNKQPFLYRNHRPETPPAWDGSTPLRLKSDPKSYTWTDAVMGELHSGPEVIDDIILIKSDGFPTYNFAHIIDDLLMECTHVIRGQEFTASTPNYLNIYEALEITPPILATVPPILGPSGNKKLSKRDGAKDILEYIEDGILPEALLNFIASLGWNDGTEQELFSVDELIEKFSLDRVQRSGAQFDDRRLLWMNGGHIRAMDIETLYAKVTDYWPASASTADEQYKKQVLALTQERLKLFSELPMLTNFFFEDLPIDMTLITGHKQLKKLEQTELVNLLTNAKETLEASDFTATDIQERLNTLLEASGHKPAVLFSLIRIATTWAPFSPSLAETLEVLGHDKVIARLNNSLSAIGS